MENISSPQILEDLYQTNKKPFAEIIKGMHEQESSLIIQYWHARLFYKPPNEKSNAKKYIFTGLLILLAWLPVRLLFLDFFKDSIYLFRAVPVVISCSLSLFFLFGSLDFKKMVLSLLPNLIAYSYIILLPGGGGSQSVNNAFYFMFVLLWFFVLFSHSSCNIGKLNFDGFIEKCGEAMVWSVIFIIGGAMIVVLSFVLFDSIGMKVMDFYWENIVPLGLVASPFVSLLVIEKSNRTKLSVIIANVFLPLILISFMAFGIMSVFNSSRLYEDRELIMVYNVMMVVVIGVLVFTGINNINNKIVNVCSCVLMPLTIVLNCVGIAAVVLRLSSYGITPNRVTLLGTNLIMLGHLIYMVFLKIKQNPGRNPAYFPLYFLWAVFVVFVFPFIFKMA